MGLIVRRLWRPQLNRSMLADWNKPCSLPAGAQKWGSAVQLYGGGRLLPGVQAVAEVGDEGGGVVATEHILTAVGELYEEAV